MDFTSTTAIQKSVNEPSSTTARGSGSGRFAAPNPSEQGILKVEDVSQKTGLPPHLQDLMTLKGDQDFISIHEWAARLCHAILVETGYFSVTKDLDIDVSPEEALEMLESTRIPKYVRRVDPNCMYSDKGIYSLTYRVILAKLLNPEGSAEEDKTEKSTEKPGNTSETDAVSNSGESVIPGENAEANSKKDHEEPRWEYKFSNAVNVTMIILQDRLVISAIYQPDDGGRPVTHQIAINIEEFLVLRVRMVPLNLRPEQWLRKFDLNSSKFSGFFKNRFAIYFMDKIDGIVFEKRGLIALPQLVMLKILKMTKVQTILNISRTCLYFYDLVSDDKLWHFLFKRDFPNEVISLGIAQGTEKKDFYEMYKEHHLSKHRSINSLSRSVRFHPNFLIQTRRIPSHPLPLMRYGR